MKTIGLLGGMSWESTVPYYRIINETVRDTLGGLHSARLLLFSLEFAELERLQHAGDWEGGGAILADAARALERGGADFLVICTNTMHKVADAVQRAVSIPLLHIADATAAVIQASQLRTIGLLGTRFTMEQDFYRSRLEAAGLTVLVPDQTDRDEVHRVIYEELCLGRIEPSSRERYRTVIEKVVASGAEGVILGCTEISMLVGPDDATVPLFDTAAIHARAAAKHALGD